MSARLSADRAYYEFVRASPGWTQFAAMHTQISGAEHRAAFVAGYQAALRALAPPPAAAARQEG